MIGMYRKRGPLSDPPPTDLQSRLKFIEDRADELRRDSPANKEMAYLVRYLAKIVRLHLLNGAK